jgi:hypothetical protein
MGLTRKEIQKAYRQRKGQVLRDKEKARSAERRKKKSPEGKKVERQQGNERMHRLRLKKKMTTMQENVDLQTPFGSKAAETKAVHRAVAGLPSSPSRRRHVVQRLAQRFTTKHFQTSKPTRCPKISEEVKEEVRQFFKRDDISRVSPNMKDVKKEKASGEYVSKRHLMWGLKETYQLYVEEHGKQLSLTCFCDLRPSKVCLFSTTPQEICLCRLHEDFIA